MQILNSQFPRWRELAARAQFKIQNSQSLQKNIANNSISAM